MKIFGKNFGWTKNDTLLNVFQLFKKSMQYINGENDGVDTLIDQSANGYDVELKQSAALVFDGVGDYSDSGLEPDENTKVVIFGRFLSTADSLGFGVIESTSQRFYWGINTGNFVASSKTALEASALAADTEYHTFTHDAVNGTFCVDGVTCITGMDFTGLDLNGRDYHFGSRNTNPTFSDSYSNFQIVWAEIYSNGVLQGKYTFSEISGPAAYDVTGNGNDGEITTTSGLTTMRAARQDVYHANAINGCSKVLSFHRSHSFGEIENSANLYEFGSGDFYIEGISDLTDPETIDCALASKYSSGDAKRGWMVKRNISGSFDFLTSPNGSGIFSLSVALANVPQRITKWRIQRVSGVSSILFDGIAAPTTGSVTSNIYTNAVPVLIGAFYTNYTESPDNKNWYLSGNLCCIDVNGTKFEIKSAYGSPVASSTDTNTLALTDTEFLYLPALDDGSDDVAGLGITNPPIGKDIVLNNCETLVQQNFFGLLHQISVSGAVVGNGLYTYAGVNEDRPYYVQGIYRLIYDTIDHSGWTLVLESGAVDPSFGSSTSTSSLPPKDLWSGPSVPVISYGLDFFINSGEWSKLSYADFKAWISGTDNIWVGMAADANGFCPVNGWAIYADGFTPTITKYSRIVRALPNTCGAGQLELAVDAVGDQAVDINGDYAIAE